MVRAELAQRWTLDEIDLDTGGPARYVSVKETGGRIGFITPMTHNFCESCNRVRLTCEDVLRLARPASGAAGRIEQAYAPRVFTAPQARFLDRTLAQAALKFVLAFPEVSVTIPGAKTPAQVEENMGASEAPDLTPDEIAQARELYENRFGL